MRPGVRRLHPSPPSLSYQQWLSEFWPKTDIRLQRSSSPLVVNAIPKRDRTEFLCEHQTNCGAFELELARCSSRCCPDSDLTTTLLFTSCCERHSKARPD